MGHPWVAFPASPGQERVGPPSPGVKMSRRLSATQRETCSIGWAVRDSSKRYGFLSAGHCGPVGGEIWYTTNAAGTTEYPLGSFIKSVNEDNFDAALVMLPPESRGWSIQISSQLKIRGFLSAAGIRALPKEAPFCLAGYASRISCGTKMSVAKLLRVKMPVREGDSGGAVFVYDSGGNAWAVGILKGTTSGSPLDDTEDNRVILIESILKQWQLELAIK